MMCYEESEPWMNDPLEEVLQKRFGLESFRPWQREAIEALLGEPGRALVVAPTGGGKSLTYQLPAAVLDGTTLVVSPLVALMEDQVRSLTQRGVAATYLASTLDMEERRRREAGVRAGQYKLVYAAPERLASDAFVRLIASSNIALVAIDEAHCISQWGHDFRPDYLRIGDLLRQLRPPRILACTATATPAVRREIRAALGLDPCREILRGFARPNLHLSALSVDGPRDARTAMFGTLRTALGEPKAPRGGAIIYAATRKSTQGYAEVLRARGYNAAYYHAGMDGDARSRVADAFAARKVDVVVATNAFGMGIDRADIRAVVHVQPPSSIEAYYQEVGRAGRDGAEALGLLLCSGADIALRRRLVLADSDPALAARAWSLFRDLLTYLDARTCRHDFVLRYFGDEQELLGGCGHCDICESLDAGAQSEESREETTLVVRKALAGVARANRRSGLVAIGEMLAGMDTEKTRRFGFTRLSTFGILKEHGQEWIVALLRATLAAGWIDLTGTDHPVPFLTRAGGEVMKGEAPARVALPQKRRVRISAPKPSAPALALDASSRDLFERLRVHRAEIARKRGLPAYVVALDRTLIALATSPPRTMAELLGVVGMGPSRVEHYGEGFLRVIHGEPRTTSDTVHS